MERNRDIDSTYWDSNRDIISTGLGIDVKIQRDSTKDTTIARKMSNENNSTEICG